MSTQHRVARGMGGTRWAGINLPSNLLTLCGSGTTGCHGWVEAHPVWATAHGWSVPRWEADEVATVPVWTWRGWVYLERIGALRPDRGHPGVPDCDCGCRPTDRTPGLWEQPASI